MLGGVQIRGNEIELLDGSLGLVVRVAHDKASEGPTLHFHALATLKDRATGDLDLCLVGRELAEVADELVVNALPPIVSAIRDSPVLGATHAWSDTENGVRGHSAYFGLVRANTDGAAVARLIEEGLFADLPELPRDGRMHLLKVVALAQGGEWRRTLELDGGTQLPDDKRHGIRSEGARDGRMVVVFVVLDGARDPLNDEGARREARRQLAAHPRWLPDPTECPAKLVPASFETHPSDPVAARGGRMLHAIRGCEGGTVELCYIAAQELITETLDSTAAQSLFLRACHLGEASGCTNAAASRKPQDDCSFETYEASCERGHDPWGCTMLGFTLIRGDARHRDIERARRVLPEGCALALGENNPACQTAKELLQSLNKP